MRARAIRFQGVTAGTPCLIVKGSGKAGHLPPSQGDVLPCHVSNKDVISHVVFCVLSGRSVSLPAIHSRKPCLLGRVGLTIQR